MDADAFGRIPNWARWILFIPAAGAAFTVAILIYEVLYNFERFFTFLGDWFEELLLTPTAFLVATSFFISVGTAMAPFRRKAVAVVLALIPLALVCVNAYTRMRGFQSDTWPLWRMTLDFIGMLAGAAFALHAVFKSDAPSATI